MKMWLFGTIMFIAFSAGMLSLFSVNYPVLVVVGSSVGGLIGGFIFRAWSKAISKSKNTFLRAVCRIVLMFSVFALGLTILLELREKYYLHIAAFIVALIAQSIAKVANIYFRRLRRSLTVTRGSRRSINITSRKKRH